LGCTCPENAFLRALLSHLMLEREEMVILDMEAGIEHLGRGTARGVDQLIVVVEPGTRSIQTAYRIKDLAKDIGIENIVAAGNKIRTDSDREFLITNMPDFQFLGFIHYEEKIVEADLANVSPFDLNKGILPEIKQIAGKIKKELDRKGE